MSGTRSLIAVRQQPSHETRAVVGKVHAGRYCSDRSPSS